MPAEDAIDFRAIFETTPAPLMVVAADLTIADVNAGFLDLLNARAASLIGRRLPDVFPGVSEVRARVRESLERVLSAGTSDVMSDVQVTVPSPDRDESTMSRRWRCMHMPVRSRGGSVDHVLATAEDITETPRDDDQASGGRHPSGGASEASDIARAERLQAINNSLLAESTQLRSLFMRAPSFMCLLRGPDYRIEMANNAFTDLVGRRQVVGRRFREAIPELVGQLYLDLLDKVFRTGEPFVGKQMRVEFERVPEQGPDEVFVSFVFQPILGEDGQVVAIFVDGNDVTDHVRAERSQALLVRELHHRVRNTLATVQGVMNSTARTAETIEDYQWAFSGRISSLARTHSLLTEEIQQFVSFPHLLRQEIGVYAEGAKDRVVLEGPDVELPSQLAVPLGMTIHELTTNAFRHGALSCAEGKVTVTWSVQPAKEKRILVCRWVEQDGPKVSPPARHGFGSMILTRVLTQQIGAKVDANYPPEGFELRVDIPLVIERV